MMQWVLPWVAALLASVLMTGMARKYALKAQLLDLPNHRSSHTQPTPRGGGIGIVVVSLLSAAALWIAGTIDTDLALAFIGGGIAIATVGFLDDRGAVPVAVRFGIHIAAAVWALYWLGGLPPILLGTHLVDIGLAGDGLAVVAIVWVLNLFNFMDGIDGLAGSEAAFITLAPCAILVLLDPGLAALAGCVGFASLGFLAWNWPPAKIFMGDVGSGFLGYAISALAIAHGRVDPVGVPVWLILGGFFFLDATLTLFRRLARRERLYEAHRSHAYQWLARRWGSHRRVTLTVVATNALWLLPCATAAVFYPNWAGWLVVIALAPLAVTLVGVGAGRREQPKL
jgi:Fuc2NAc and GlcNAc transferase